MAGERLAIPNEDIEAIARAVRGRTSQPWKSDKKGDQYIPASDLECRVRAGGGCPDRDSDQAPRCAICHVPAQTAQAIETKCQQFCPGYNFSTIKNRPQFSATATYNIEGFNRDSPNLRKRVEFTISGHSLDEMSTIAKRPISSDAIKYAKLLTHDDPHPGFIIVKIFPYLDTTQNVKLQKAK
jgi:hypothetical protein